VLLYHISILQILNNHFYLIVKKFTYYYNSYLYIIIIYNCLFMIIIILQIFIMFSFIQTILGVTRWADGGTVRFWYVGGVRGGVTIK
jgi:hypothetical protein